MRRLSTLVDAGSIVYSQEKWNDAINCLATNVSAQWL
jgi:hypothetical protein